MRYCSNCGAAAPSAVKFCQQCGRALETTAASPRAPAEGPSSRAYRDGRKLVILHGAKLPSVCVKCGQNSARSVRKSFLWHWPHFTEAVFYPWWLWWLYVFELRINTIVVGIPLCRRHWEQRRWRLVIGWVTLVGALVASPLVDAHLGTGWSLLIFFPGVIAGTAIVVIAGRVLWPTYVDHEFGAFRGACERFLALLPESPLRWSEDDEWWPRPRQN